jgi:Collagen triple helix repeat (20 copies)
MKSRLRHPIRAIREPFGTAGLIVACIALVLALTGAAFAAAGLSGKQKKEVEKIAKKFAGKPGAQGPVGPVGPQGPVGAKGDAGSAGANGAAGATGPTGAHGATGADGNSVTSSPVLVGDPACGGRGGAIYEVEGSNVETEVCNGSVGQDAGFNFDFATNTELTDPGSGNVKLDNAAPGSANNLLISKTDANSNGLAEAIKRWTTGPGAQGTVLIRKDGSPGTFAEYNVRGGIVCTPEQETANPEQCGLTDEGTYYKLRVIFVAGNGTFANTDPVTVAYWSAGATTLPVGAVETGAWSFSGSGEQEVETEVEGSKTTYVVGNKQIYVPISFSVPMGAALAETSVHYQTDADFTTFCKGGSALPSPLSGQLCVYQGAPGALSNATFVGIDKVGDSTLGSTGANRAGAVLVFELTGANASGNGTFAVAG